MQKRTSLSLCPKDFGKTLELIVTIKRVLMVIKALMIMMKGKVEKQNLASAWLVAS